MESLPPDVRRAQILGRIQRTGSVSVNELARDYTVSFVTVHRDLERLARQGLVARIHGGARALPGVDQRIETDYAKRLRQARAAKETIAARAAQWVEDDSTIFLDHSTSCLALAKQLEQRPPKALTLVTNSPAIAFELHANSIHVIVTPGEIDQTVRMIAGGWTEEFLSHLNFSVAFISAAGVTLERGLTTTRQALAATLNAARAVSVRMIGLIDASKFGRDSLLTIARAQDLDSIVVDESIPDETREAYLSAGVRLLVAHPAGATLAAGRPASES